MCENENRALLTACSSGDNPGPPTAAKSRDTLVTFYGNAQQWFAGAELPERVIAAVYDEAGKPISGVPLRFFNTSGTDSTDGTGNAVARMERQMR